MYKILKNFHFSPLFTIDKCKKVYYNIGVWYTRTKKFKRTKQKKRRKNNESNRYGSQSG